MQAVAVLVSLALLQRNTRGRQLSKTQGLLSSRCWRFEGMTLTRLSSGVAVPTMEVSRGGSVWGLGAERAREVGQACSSCSSPLVGTPRAH